MKYFTQLSTYFSQIQLSKSFARWNINYYAKQSLGRWDIDYCPDKINIKVKFANEDNCGPTGRYEINNNKLNI
jgi:hypothetical protein